MYGYFLLLPMAAHQTDFPKYPTALMNMSSNYGRKEKEEKIYAMSMKLKKDGGRGVWRL